MTFDRFETWIKSHKIFSFFLTILFIFVTFFQATDTFTRVKAWFSPDTYTIMSLKDGEVEHIRDPIEENIQVEGGVEILYLTYHMTEAGHKNLNEQLTNANNEIWLINVNVVETSSSMIGTSEALTRIRLNTDMGFTVKIINNVEEHASFEIHFPQINTERQWSDFTHMPVTASYGQSTNTAFYRLVEFQPKGRVGFETHYKAEYIVPDATKAQRTMSELATTHMSQKYFKSAESQ